MSDQPALAKVELRAYLLTPVCSQCETLRAKKGTVILTDASMPKMEWWVCPDCQDEIQVPAGVFPRMIHEEVSTDQFILPEIGKPS